MQFWPNYLSIYMCAVGLAVVSGYHRFCESNEKAEGVGIFSRDVAFY